jgi:anaerobic ribonucleoside-triphosphate reductase
MIGVMPLSEIKKRDGRVVPFELPRIERAVARAAREVGRDALGLDREVTARAVTDLASRFRRRIP